MTKKQAVLSRLEDFNVVRGWITPNRDLILSLSHKTVDDLEVLVRIPTEDDIVLVDEELKDDPDAWENLETRLGRLNKQGNWNDMPVGQT